MLRVAAELQDVQLREAHVFQQHPGGMRKVRNFDSGELHGPVTHGIVEASVRSAPLQQVKHVLA
jgi:hypothetical protein